MTVNIRTLSQLFSLRDLRNAFLGIAVVVGGIGLSVLTLYAHRSGNPRLAGTAAVISLLFVLLILIFVVPPLAKNAGKEASQMNLPFEFTAGGAIVLGLIAVVGFSAWNTGNNLLFLVLSFLSAAMLVGFFAGSFVLKKLDVKMRFPETIYAGQETPILVSLNNRKRIFPSYSVVAEVRGRERERSVAADDLEKILPKWIAERLSRPPVVRRTLSYFVHVPRRTTAENKTDHIFRRRGRFVIKDFELSTRFPFGFFRHRRRLTARETELIVFPKVEPIDNELDDMPLEAGKIVANKRGLGQDLLALRDYRPNDDLRRVDWKATARSQQLTVREFSAEDDKRITVFFDTRVPEGAEKKATLRERIEAEQREEGFVLSERFERGVELAASLISHFTDEQAEIRLVIDSKESDYGIGARHLHECLKQLALVEPTFVRPEAAGETERRFIDIVDQSSDSHSFVVTTQNTAKFNADTGDRLVFIGY